MTAETPSTDPLRTGPRAGRWPLVRRVLIFQVKLGLDGLRDVLLSPISLVALLLDLAAGDDRNFRRLLHLGRRSDRWIDLFEHRRRTADGAPARTAEALIDSVEGLVREEYARMQAGTGGHAQAPSASRLEQVLARARELRARLEATDAEDDGR